MCCHHQGTEQYIMAQKMKSEWIPRLELAGHVKWSKRTTFEMGLLGLTLLGHALVTGTAQVPLQNLPRDQRQRYWEPDFLKMWRPGPVRVCVRRRLCTPTLYSMQTGLILGSC
jgi:hypothetical protein